MPTPLPASSSPSSARCLRSASDLPPSSCARPPGRTGAWIGSRMRWTPSGPECARSSEKCSGWPNANPASMAGSTNGVQPRTESLTGASSPPAAGARRPGSAAARIRPRPPPGGGSQGSMAAGPRGIAPVFPESPGRCSQAIDIQGVERGRDIFYPHGDGVLPWFEVGSRGLLADFTPRSHLRGHGVLGTARLPDAGVPPANGMARPPPIDAGGTQACPGRRAQERSREACPAKTPPRTCLPETKR